jgi:DNA-binding NtrC family response regulator
MSSVLIVEDFDVIRDLLCGILSADYECVAVGSAEEGLDLLDARRFDAAVADVKLPGMSGGDFLRLAREKSPELPVIVISGGHEGRPAEEFLDAGAFGYLLKPFTAGEIEEMVGRAVARRSGGGLSH